MDALRALLFLLMDNHNLVWDLLKTLLSSFAFPILVNIVFQALLNRRVIMYEWHTAEPDPHTAKPRMEWRIMNRGQQGVRIKGRRDSSKKDDTIKFTFGPKARHPQLGPLKATDPHFIYPGFARSSLTSLEVDDFALPSECLLVIPFIVIDADRVETEIKTDPDNVMLVDVNMKREKAAKRATILTYVIPVLLVLWLLLGGIYLYLGRSSLLYTLLELVLVLPGLSFALLVICRHDEYRDWL